MEKLTNPVYDYLEILERKDFDEMLALAYSLSDVNLLHTILENCENIDHKKFAFYASWITDEDELCELIDMTDGHAKYLIDWLFSDEFLNNDINKIHALVSEHPSKELKRRFIKLVGEKGGLEDIPFMIDVLTTKNGIKKDKLADRLLSIANYDQILEATINGVGFNKTNFLKYIIRFTNGEIFAETLFKIQKQDKNISNEKIVDLILAMSPSEDKNYKLYRFAQFFGGSKKIEDYFIEIFNPRYMALYANNIMVANVDRINKKMLKDCNYAKALEEYALSVRYTDKRKFIRKVIELGDAKIAMFMIIHGRNSYDKEVYTEKIILDAINLAIEKGLDSYYLNHLDSNKFLKKNQDLLVEKILEDKVPSKLYDAFTLNGLTEENYERILDAYSLVASYTDMMELYNKTVGRNERLWNKYNVTKMIIEYSKCNDAGKLLAILKERFGLLTEKQRYILAESIIEKGDSEVIYELALEELMYVEYKLYDAACDEICLSNPDIICKYAIDVYNPLGDDRDVYKLTDALIEKGSLEHKIKLVTNRWLPDECISKIEDSVLATNKLEDISRFLNECIAKIHPEKFINYIDDKNKEDFIFNLLEKHPNMDLTPLTNDFEIYEIVRKYVDNDKPMSHQNLHWLVSKAAGLKEFGMILAIAKRADVNPNTVLDATLEFATSEELLKLFDVSESYKPGVVDALIGKGDLKALLKIAFDDSVRELTDVEDILINSNDAEILYRLVYISDYIKNDAGTSELIDIVAPRILETKNAEYIAKFFVDCASQLMFRYASQLKEYASEITKYGKEKKFDNVVKKLNGSAFIAYQQDQKLDVYKTMLEGYRVCGRPFDNKYLSKVIETDEELIDELITQVRLLDEYIMDGYWVCGREGYFYDEKDFPRICRESGTIDKFIDVLHNGGCDDDVMDTLIQKYYLEDEFVNGPQKIRKPKRKNQH